MKKRADFIRKSSSVPVDIQYSLFSPWSTMSMLLPYIPFINLVSMNGFMREFEQMFSKAKTGTITVVSPFVTYMASRSLFLPFFAFSSFLCFSFRFCYLTSLLF